MTEKTIYIAFDGKEFDNEYDCREYELSENAKNIGDDLLMYDENGKQMFITQSDCNYNRIDYVIFKSKIAYDCFTKKMLYDYDIPYPNEEEVKSNNYKCSYYYDYEYDKWRDINNKIAELQSQIDNLSKYIVKND